MSAAGWLEPLLDAEQMRATDEWAIETRGVPSLDLMENAGAAVAEEAAQLAKPGPARVVCGKGNNGGDGLVAARRLAELGFEAEALLLWPHDQLSADAAANLERFPGAREVDEGGIAEALGGSGVVVDAIFGTGFSGAPRSPAHSAIEAINATGVPVAAADIPSGVDATTGEAEGAAVRADATVTFHSAKIGHWIAPGKRLAGEVRVVDIGIPPGGGAEPAAGLISREVLRLAPPRGPESTKFSSGQVLVVGGSRGLTGAVCMAADAAARAGAGYATVAVPADLESIFEVKLTEVMSVGCPSEAGHLSAGAADRILEVSERGGAVILGPGLGRTEGAQELVDDLVGRIEAPLVVDADGLNALAGSLERLSGCRGPVVVTPHAGELARLLGTDSESVGRRRLESAREAASRSGAVVVLKGDDTLVVSGPDHDGNDGGPTVAINALGAPALATAGTGDVLSGVIAAMLARGVEPFAAASAGVLAHAIAGREAAHSVGAPESVVATDVIAALPAAFE